MDRLSSKGKDEFTCRIENEKQTIPRKSRNKLRNCEDFVRNVKQEIAKKLRSYEESAAKKRIDPDNWALMNCLCNRRGILLLWVSSWLKFRIYRTRRILGRCKRNLRSWIREQLWSDQRTSQPSIIPSPEEYLAAILDCRSMHGRPRVLQEMFLKVYLLQKDHPQLSSRIHRIWHHLLADWDQVLQEIFWNMEEEWDESRRVRHQHHVFNQCVEPWTPPFSFKLKAQCHA